MNINETLLLLILTLILGYFLGLMISSTVDYKLNDMIINLPKNNIIYKYEKNKKTENKKKIVNNETENIETKNIEKENNEIENNEIENNEIESNEIENNELDDNEIENKENNITDDNLKIYDLNYNNSSNILKNDKNNFKFMAANEEDQNQLYSDLI